MKKFLYVAFALLFVICTRIFLKTSAVNGSNVSETTPGNENTTPDGSNGVLNMKELPLINTKSDIEKNDGENVQIIGRYRQIDVRMRPHGSPVYKGHVEIVLEDSTNVLLYPVWHDEAKRTSDEITSYENKIVTVTGTIYSQAPGQRIPDNPNIVTSNMVTPCVFPVDSIIESKKQ